MVPLPKTDSREFDIANPEAPPTASGLNDFSESRYEASFRIWSKGNSAVEPLGVSWATQITLVQMIADLVIVGEGELASEISDEIIARFSSLPKALVAAKRILRSVSLFGNARPQDCCSLGIAIARRGQGDAIDLEQAGAPKRNLLDYVRPGSIVLSEEICKQLQAVPGLRLRKLGGNSLISGEAELGIRELVWTPTRNSAPSQDISAQPLKVVTPKPTSNIARGADSVRSEPKEVDELANSTSLRPPRDSQLRKHGSVSTSRAPNGLDLEDASTIASAPRNRKGIGVRIGIVGVLVLVFSVLFFLAYHGRSAPRINSQFQKNETKQPVPATSNVAEPPPGNHGAVPGSTPTTAEVPATSSKAPAIPNNQELNPPSPKPQQKQRRIITRSTQISEPQDHTAKAASADGYFFGDIPFLLVKADQDGGSGNYSDARHEYQVVLRLDPGNLRAKQGLHRLELSAKEPNN